MGILGQFGALKSTMMHSNRINFAKKNWGKIEKKAGKKGEIGENQHVDQKYRG